MNEEQKHQAESRLPDFVTIDWTTYKGVRQPCRFFDNKYGEFWAIPQNLLYYGSCGHRKRWGEERGKKRRLSEDQIRSKLPPFTDIDISTYSGIHTKAKFIDEDYGVFWADPASVLHGKSQHPKRSRAKMAMTCMEKYGVPHAAKNKEIAKKMARGQTAATCEKHWKTGESCVCVGSYERAVIQFLNANKIDYVWQIPFTMPNGKVYICDLLLTEENKYVEIKGFFRKDAREKWTWFLSIYPNAELWDKTKLKSMGFEIKKTGVASPPLLKWVPE
jgi:hypothetical protein